MVEHRPVGWVFFVYLQKDMRSSGRYLRLPSPAGAVSSNSKMEDVQQKDTFSLTSFTSRNWPPGQFYTDLDQN